MMPPDRDVEKPAGRPPGGRPLLGPRSFAAAAGLILLAVAAVHGRTVRFGFAAWDDDDLLLRPDSPYRNPSRGELLSLLDPRSDRSRFGREYLPVRDLSWMRDAFFFGLNPFAFHLWNLLLFALYGIGVFLFLARLLGRGGPALAAALLLLLHPLNADPAAWITARKDLLAGVFSVVALLAVQRFARAGGRPPAAPGRREKGAGGPLLLLAGSAVLLAVFSKLTAVFLPAALFLLERTLGRRGIGPWARLALFALPAAAAVAVGLFVSAAAGGAAKAEPFYPGATRPLLCAQALAVYARLAIFPAGIEVVRDGPSAFPPAVSAVVLASIVFALLAAFAARGFLRRAGPGPAAFACGFILLAFFPVSNLPILPPIPVAERYAFFPLLGAALLAAALMRNAEGAVGGPPSARSPAARPFAGSAAGAGGPRSVAVLALLILLGAASWIEGGKWASPRALWESALEKTPDSVIARVKLGRLLAPVDPGAGRRLLEEAVALAPSNLWALTSLAKVHFAAGDLGAARRLYARALGAVGAQEWGLRADLEKMLEETCARMGEPAAAAAHRARFEDAARRFLEGRRGS